MKTTSNSRGSRQLMIVTLTVATVFLTLSSTVLAQREHRSRPPQWHGDIGRFHEHDWGLWRGGHWTRARHDGRLGWWWVVGTSWYFYPAPVYPYPNPWEPPPAIVVNPPLGYAPSAPPTQYWYYCESSRGYYPYVPTCADGWKQVPAMPSDASSDHSR